MTGPKSTPQHASLDSELSFADRFDQYRKHVAWVGIAILVVGAGSWYYVRARVLKEERGETAYASAMRSAMSGNVPLAQADLKKVSTRYAGTAAGTEAAMALAKLYYNAGKYQDGVNTLKAVQPVDDLRYDLQNLIAAGYDGLQKPADAAKAYTDAAAAARFDTDRDAARASAARAYQDAGNRAEAVKIWTDLAKDPNGPLAPEARVRLGELQATITRIG